jgi:hypothetical protein
MRDMEDVADPVIPFFSRIIRKQERRIILWHPSW